MSNLSQPPADENHDQYRNLLSRAAAHITTAQRTADVNNPRELQRADIRDLQINLHFASELIGLLQKGLPS